MASKTRLVVEIEDLGLDGRRDVLKLLNEATAADHVEWTAVEVEGEPHQGVAEIIFVAVTTKVAEQVLVKVEAAVEPWCRRGLEKIRHRVGTEPVESGAETEPAGVTAAESAESTAAGSADRSEGDEV